MYSRSANESTLKRTVAPADVFAALSELEFDSFRTRLEAELEAYTEIKAGKRKGKKDGDDQDRVNGGGGVGGDEDVEMSDNPAKRVKRDSEGVVNVEGEGDGDETQEEEIEGEEEEDVEDEEVEEEEEEDEAEKERVREEDIDRVEDLDHARRPVDPDAEESEEDDGPASQLRDDMGLG